MIFYLLKTKVKMAFTENILQKENHVLDVLLSDNEHIEWYKTELSDGGPEHKKILSALLLSVLDKLVKKVEVKTGTRFTPTSGMTISKEYNTGAEAFPIDVIMPKGGEEILEVISQAPDHELLVYLTALQAIEWSTKSL